MILSICTSTVHIQMLNEDTTEALNTISYHCPLLMAMANAYHRAATWKAINNIDLVTCG
jgi:hypothetical protein